MSIARLLLIETLEPVELHSSLAGFLMAGSRMPRFEYGHTASSTSHSSADTSLLIQIIMRLDISAAMRERKRHDRPVGRSLPQTSDVLSRRNVSNPYHCPRQSLNRAPARAEDDDLERRMRSGRRIRPRVSSSLSILGTESLPDSGGVRHQTAGW